VLSGFTSAAAATPAAVIRAAADLVEQAGIGEMAVSCHHGRILVHVAERDGDPAARARMVAAVAGVLGCVPAQWLSRSRSPRFRGAWIPARSLLLPPPPPPKRAGEHAFG